MDDENENVTTGDAKGAAPEGGAVQQGAGAETRTDGATQVPQESEELRALRLYREAVHVLQDPETDPELREQALVYTMKVDGAGDLEIRTRIEQLRKGNEKAEEKPEAKGGEKSDEIEELKRKLGEIEEDMGQAKSAALKARADQLGRRLNEAIEEVLDQEAEKGILKELGSIRSPEDIERAKVVLRDQIAAKTNEAMIRRAKAAGRLNEGWIGEEVVKAAKSVVGDYRTVIGDPSGLGRAPEMAGGRSDAMPVPEAKFPDLKKGSRGDVTAQASQWATSVLLKAVRNSPGAGSKA